LQWYASATLVGVRSRTRAGCGSGKGECGHLLFVMLNLRTGCEERIELTELDLCAREYMRLTDAAVRTSCIGCSWGSASVASTSAACAGKMVCAARWHTRQPTHASSRGTRSVRRARVMRARRGAGRAPRIVSKAKEETYYIIPV
jgi:hypothetical protein